MRYLLDTNVCIEILRGRNPALRSRLELVGFDQLALCSVVWAELLCGAHLSSNPERERQRVLTAFQGWQRLPFDDGAAERYGVIRAQLQRSGRLIGANDLFIASIALAQGLTLVTHNAGEFGRVDGLVVEDWEAEGHPGASPS
ncbi:MAG: type II toxin-antitoxin system VapC family toxin [Betaproteobacteria bacterium]|nr:type II toxin-antitoxin system VapC family toxin [Betaproteobacteria bacterium]